MKGGEAMGNQGKWVVSTSELSEILGLTDRRIQQLVKNEIISRVGRGKFHLPTVIGEYIGWIKSQSTESDEELDLKKEKTLLTRANRQKIELELQIMRGELHRSEDVRRVMNDMLGAFRARCLAIPSKAAPRILAQTDLAVIQDAIKKEVYEALTELADYDPQAFYAHSKDTLALNSVSDEIDEVDEPSKKEKPKRNGRTKKQE
jgi:phage terminase Nu1 subunit (DNA packaging protein)